MTQQLWTSVDDYITDLFVPFDAVMQGNSCNERSRGAAIHQRCAERGQTINVARAALRSVKHS
jgi:hypothetical protein